MKEFFLKLDVRILPGLLPIYLKTIRIEIAGKPEYDKACVFIFWHSKMLVGWWLFRELNYTALISKSKDGDILAKLLSSWDYKLVRGSSSKGGKEAVNEIISLVKTNRSCVITPDGPRGPAYEIKNGALIVSNECNVPVVPLSITCSHKHIFTKSWDKFELPLPFSRCSVRFGKQFYYENYLDEEQLKIFKKEISKEMGS